MESFDPTTIDADHAAWKQFGGLNNTDHPGYDLDSIRTGRNKAHLSIDDMWNLGIRNLDTEGLINLASQIVRNTARLTIEESAENDPTKPRYARVPSGAKTCAFCLMLASRGFAYSTEKTAGGEEEKYHNDCDCTIIPSWGKTRLHGYDPDALADMWRNATEAADGGDYRLALSKMRRMYPRDLTDGLYTAKKRAGWSIEKNILSMRGERSLSKKAWDARQKKLGIPLSKDVLEMHEIVFLERFKALGNKYEWILKDPDGRPTNDFRWIEKNTDFEVKSMASLKYRSVSNRIRMAAENAAKQNITKDSFIIDYGNAHIPDKLITQLEKYNLKHKSKLNRLYVFDSTGLREINLKK